MEKKRFCSFILSLVLLLTMVPAGVYAEVDPPGTARVSNQVAFDMALADGLVDHIIVESMILSVTGFLELTKDLTISTNASLVIENEGYFLINSNITLSLQGDMLIQEGGKIAILSGIIYNAGAITVGGLLNFAVPAQIHNSGVIEVSTNPAIGLGSINVFDYWGDWQRRPGLSVLEYDGNPVEGEIYHILSVDGPMGLDYGIADSNYDEIWMGELASDNGVIFSYPGDLILNKVLRIPYNSTQLRVTGELQLEGDGAVIIDELGFFIANEIQGISVHVDTQDEYVVASNDPNVGHIIVESMDLTINNYTEVNKHLTITTTAGLIIENGGYCLVDESQLFVLEGNTIIREGGELAVSSGRMENTGTITVGGTLDFAVPVQVRNDGVIQISADPDIGLGKIQIFDYWGDQDYRVGLYTVKYGGNPIEGNLYHILSVEGSIGLEHGLTDSKYDEVRLGELVSDGEIIFTYDGNLTVGKVLNNSYSNSHLYITEDLTISSGGGALYAVGDVTVNGDLANNGYMFIKGNLTVSGPAINYGEYTQSAEGMITGTITDVGDGNHMRGYYVTNQSEWETALADSAHCNPIVIGPEAVAGSAIVVATDTAIACNLIVEGELRISEGAGLTVDLRYDGNTFGSYNGVSGILSNYGTLNVNAPFFVSGNLYNYGTMLTAAKDGDANGEGWTRDGTITLYSWSDGSTVFKDGYLENNGTIYNDAVLVINNMGALCNAETGLIQGGRIARWEGEPFENVDALHNEGLICNAEIELDYTHLACAYLGYSWEDGWYENPEAQSSNSLREQPGSNPTLMFGLWDYDESEGWGFISVTPGALSVSSGSGIAVEPLNPSQISANPAHDTHNSGSYVSMAISQWGDFEVSYTDSVEGITYRLPVTVDLPDLGFYNARDGLPVATRENYITGFSRPYTPDTGDGFYAIAQGDFSSGWDSQYQLVDGGESVTVTATTDPAIYLVTVNEGVAGNFNLHLKIILDNPATSAHWEEERWIELQEADREGLVCSWVDWWPENTWPNYPTLGKYGPIGYQTALDTDPGRKTLAFFHKHWVGDEAAGNWVYTTLSAVQLSVTSGSGIQLSAWSNDELGVIEDPDHNAYAFSDVETPNFGNYMISYNNGESVFELPVTVGLPQAGYYSATSAAMEYYIGDFSYGAAEGERQFYLIASPSVNIDDSWTTDVQVHDGSDYVTITPTLDEEVFLVTVKPEAPADFRLHAEIRYFDGINLLPVWQSDRDINLSEAPTEGLVFNWPEWRGDPDFDYPAVSKGGDGNIVTNPSMEVAIGGATVPLFFRHPVGEEWVLDPVDPAAVTVSSGSGIEVREWSAEGSAAITDPDYKNYRFAEIGFPQFGAFELTYTTGSGIYTLPVTVGLPDAGFYTAALASEGNYISEFHYGADERSFYFIADPDIEIESGWTCEVEVWDGADWMEITTTGSLGVFLVTVNEDTEGDFRFHGRIRYFDETHDVRWQADRDILIFEAEVPGLVYCWVDWKNAENIQYPALTGEPLAYDRGINASKGNYTFAFFYKHWVGDEVSGYWDYTSVSPDQLIVTTESGITRTLWTHENIGNIPADDAQYRDYLFADIGFPSLGDFTIGYRDGETLYQLTAHIALPGLGAYTTPGGGEAGWLPEVAFDELRSVYLVPTVDLSGMDLTQSTFYLPDGAGEIPYAYDGGTKTFSKAGYGSITAHETEGVVDSFTMDISALPFDPDFDLGLRLRDGSGQEIVGTTIRFVSSMQDADARDSGAVLAAPGAAGEENDTSAALPAVPAGSIRWASFTAGDPGANGHLFKLAGVCPGARLYLFDSNWLLVEASSYENLNDRTADIWTSELTGGAVYYLAARNESDAACDLALSAGLRATPAAPAVALASSEQGTVALSASGAAAGQEYILYAKVEGQWQRRGSEPFDPEREPRLVHAFDFLDSGQTATALAAAIRQDGVEGPKAEVAVNITRTDSVSAGMSVTLMDFPESENAYLKGDGAVVFSAGGYYRLHHEDATGYWNYNGSFFGDGGPIAGGGAQMDEAGDFGAGFWLLSEYRQTGTGSSYTVGWIDHVDGRIGLGSLDRDNFNLSACSIDTVNQKVDATVTIRTLAAPTPAAVDAYFAIYDSAGRMIDIVFRNDVPLNGYGCQEGAALYYTGGSDPARCKVFVLGGDMKPYFEDLEVIFPE